MRQSAIGNRQSACRSVADCWLLIAGCCLLVTGCVRRQLTIRSEPPGATVMINDEVLGVTPHSYDFLWYGWHRISLTKDGYERLDDRVKLTAPPALWVPFDLAMELLPVTFRDDRQFSYQLAPLVPLPDPTPPISGTEAATSETPPAGE
jgi:hypothetical protein